MRVHLESLERHQAACYLLALGLGAAIGLLLPQLAPVAQPAVTPLLAALLFVTFLGVPFARIVAALRDTRFLVSVLVLNFILAPAVVFALSRIVAHEQALLIGVLLVLLTPCVDYVIVFTGLAGGASERLLAAAPLLMIVQMLLLPLYLGLMAGPESAATIELQPFLDAFLQLIVLPLLAAALVQFAAARHRLLRGAERVALAGMVPIMVLTLATVVIAQIGGVADRLPELLLAVPVFLLYTAVMVPLGILLGRLARLDDAARRAVIFTGVTRNSLVVLPLALALPAALDLAPLVVVTQTLVELVVMVVLVRALPRLMTGPRRLAAAPEPPNPEAGSAAGGR